MTNNHNPIHDELRLALERIYDRFGLLIDALDVTWTDISSTESTGYVIKDIKLIARTKAR